MVLDDVKIYEVKVTFEYEGLTYQAGEKYQLGDSVVATLPEGTVLEYIVVPDVPPVVDPVVEPSVSSTPETPTPAAEEDTQTPAPTTEATPWVGNHTVGLGL